MDPMRDLIYRDDAIKALGDEPEIENLIYYDMGRYSKWKEDREAIEAVPVAKPVEGPVRIKGKWIKIGHFGRSYKCDQCGNYLDFDGVNAGRGDANFCVNCGADMREEDDG